MKLSGVVVAEELDEAAGRLPTSGHFYLAGEARVWDADRLSGRAPPPWLTLISEGTQLGSLDSTQGDSNP